jgi:prephenate dehydratase
MYVSFQQQLMEISKRWQRIILSGINVACAGPAGSAGYNAAGKIFPEGNVLSFEKCRDAYRAVETGECEVAVLPVENSYSGEVGKVYDLIFSGGLYVNDIFASEDEDSTTRYAVLSRTNRDPDGEAAIDSFLIMFTVRDEIGGLAKAINIISAYDFNMRVLRSRPLKGLEWHYYFYAELEGECSSENVEKIRRALSAECPAVKIVGTICNTGDISRNQ